MHFRFEYILFTEKEFPKKLNLSEKKRKKIKETESYQGAKAFGTTVKSISYHGIAVP